jgi:hypothetical protein
MYSCYIVIYTESLFLQDVHETAAGALWNLAFYSSNALRIVEEGGVPILVHLCSSSGSKMARFMSALALAYMFDGRYTFYETYHACLLFNINIWLMKQILLAGYQYANHSIVLVLSCSVSLKMQAI